MEKLKLKVDEDGNKTSQVHGIRAKCKVMKTRYNKPFEDIEVQIPYSTGMNLYSGLVDLCEKRELLKKDGNSLRYDSPNGNSIKKFRKAWEKNDDGCLDLIMAEWEQTQKADEVHEEIIDMTEDQETE